MSWPNVKLGKVAAIARATIQPGDIPGEARYIGLENIERGGAIVRVGTAAESHVASAKFAFDESQVLFGKLRPYLAKIARPMFAGVCSTDILPISPGEELDRNYLAHFLAYPPTVDLASARSTGANLPRLAPKELANFEIPLPPLAEQERIAEVLDGVDSLRAMRRQAIVLLDELARSVFLDMFGDPVMNPRAWPTRLLEEFGSLDRGVSKHRPRNDPLLLGGPYPLIQTGDVALSGGYIKRFSSTYSEFGLAQSRLWPAGTLCITIAANIAKVGILEFDACFPDSVVGFTASPNGVEFVRAAFSFFQERLEELAPQSAQKNINLETLRTLRIPDPGQAHVDRFAGRIATLEADKAKHRTHLAKLDELFLSVQSRAFAGTLFE